MSSRIVIGDVHGCFLTLMALIEKLPKGIPITISGDLIDRGPRSREVVQYCIDNNIDVTSGNHEKMMVDESNVWLMNGGYECLESYGCESAPSGKQNHIVFPNDEMINAFESHKEYMRNLPLFIEYSDVVSSDGRVLVVSHSSIGSVWKYKDIKNEWKRVKFEENVLWGRPSTINDVKSIYNIFGHTPVKDGPKIKKPFANLDTGCCFTAKRGFHGFGQLTALQYPEMTMYQQDNID